MRASATLSYFGVPRRSFDLLPQVFAFGKYGHVPPHDKYLGGAWFQVSWGETELTIFLAEEDLAQYRADKCLD